MTDKIVLESVQPILDSSRPAFINRLHLIRCNLGTIAPVITGVRSVHTSTSPSASCVLSRGESVHNPIALRHVSLTAPCILINACLALPLL